jgi:hypothetical protein
MEPFEPRREQGPGGATPAPGRDFTTQSPAGESQKPQPWGGPGPDLRRTRGGSGATAGATPKKACRPPCASRRRPAGKKRSSERD